MNTTALLPYAVLLSSALPLRGLSPSVRGVFMPGSALLREHAGPLPSYRWFAFSQCVQHEPCFLLNLYFPYRGRRTYTEGRVCTSTALLLAFQQVPWTQ